MKIPTTEIDQDTPQDSVETTGSDDNYVLVADDLIPCNWTITAADGEDQIHAINIKTQTEFEGAIADFNMLLKG